MSYVKDLTLRDLFAAVALHGIVARMTDEERSHTDWSFEAGDAYDAADAMLKRREEEPDG